jgi:hypothetical protein
VLAELDNIVLQASGASLGVRHRFGCTGSIRGPRRRGRLTNGCSKVTHTGRARVRLVQ